MTFEEECLQAHNEFRAKHGVPPLTYNAHLSQDAKTFAEKLFSEGTPRNSNNLDLGENIYSARSSNPNYNITGNIPVEMWYSKASEYDYSKEPSGSNAAILNFTQVIWKSSKELGVGAAQKGGRIIVVTRYSPAGNMRGEFQSNVLPPNKVQAIPSSKSIDHSVLAASSATADKSYSGDFNTDCLKQHNMYRAKHGVPPLILDEKLCQYSQKWANTMGKSKTMQHNPENLYGENIFYFRSSDPNYLMRAETAVDTWYNEIKFYTFGREPTDFKAAHFTQVVWKNTNKLGVGLFKNNGTFYVVCNYDPPGNWNKNYVANVPAPK